MTTKTITAITIRVLPFRNAFFSSSMFLFSSGDCKYLRMYRARRWTEHTYIQRVETIRNFLAANKLAEDSIVSSAMRRETVIVLHLHM